MNNAINNMTSPLSLQCGDIILLKFKNDTDELKFISQNAYIVSVLQNGKIIANSCGFTVVEVYKGITKYAEILCNVLPGKPNYPVLFNRYNKISYPSGRLELLNKKYTFRKRSFNTVTVLQKSFYKMCEDAKQNNVYILVSAGYRSVSTQIKIINKFINLEGRENAMKRCAPPGFSEHHTGLALDVCGGKMQDGEFVYDNECVYAWIKENSYKYGFMIKNPPNKEHITGTIYEPWHIRYIGNKRIAAELHNESITLDEYYDLYRKVTTEINADKYIISAQPSLSDQIDC